jgi:hypothetical protein
MLLPQRPVFVRSDMVWINNAISEFTVIALHAAAQVPGVKFIDMYNVFNGHELCNLGKKDSWLNRVNRDLAESFHPTVRGHRAEADWIMQRMR